MSGAEESIALVDGATRLYGIIGDPIAQVRSPEVMTARFRAAGRNAIMVPLHVLPERFDESVPALKSLANLDGLIITVPYKLRIVPHVDRLLPTGAAVRAINAMRREKDGSWSGDMFDGRGLVRSMAAEGLAIAGLRVMQLGAGGAGSAVAFAMAEAGAAALTLFDVAAAKAADLAARVAAAYPRCAVSVAPATVAGQDILINATPVGMTPGDGLPAELGTLDPALLVIDVVMKPPLTPLLRHAEACGCRTMGGRFMLAGQVEEVVRFFGIGG
ncbi:MAG: shikimate dehydrogenase family protein [Alphaproteobacteria bacterium]